MMPGVCLSGVVSGIAPRPGANAFYAAGGSPSASPEELNNSWGVARSFADAAHARGITGRGITVAILDTGMAYDHPDLAGTYIGGTNFVRDIYNNIVTTDPYDDNFESHGTHLAGIIAAQDNGFGVVGVAPDAKILAVKVMDGAGFGDADWVIEGINWSVAHGANIINMSFTGQDSQALKDACDAARSAGVLLVAAAGNTYTGGWPVEYPAAYDSVIAVTATDPQNHAAYFAPVGDELELAAPGTDIYSTVAGGGYATLSGTSEAAAFVTGVAALYLQSNTQDLNHDGMVDSEDTRLLLQRSATDLGLPGRDPTFGYGLVNADAVPEPSSLLLLVAAGAPLLGLIAARRRK
jgi:subtilisin